MNPMPEDNNLQEPFEDDGITLGPEEALQREIEKSKALKVEKLKLRDEIEKLRAEQSALAEENQRLKRRIEDLQNRSASSPPPDSETEGRPRTPLKVLPAKWPVFLLIFNLTAIGLLIVLLLQK